MFFLYQELTALQQDRAQERITRLTCLLPDWGGEAGLQDIRPGCKKNRLILVSTYVTFSSLPFPLKLSIKFSLLYAVRAMF